MTNQVQPNLMEMFNLSKPIELDDVQKQAVAACCDISRRVVAITGKAGTGKTSIIRAVRDDLVSHGYTVQCSAPTGKAAKRMREVAGLDAMTNHRLLGYGMPLDLEVDDEKTGDKKIVKVSTGPTYKRDRPLPYDVIICDEYAMVNTEIHANLIAALKGGACIRMFGDVNQLKPIEETTKKQEATDAIESPFQAVLRKFEGIELLTNHRQVDGSGIHENAERILQGMMPVRKDDFGIIYTGTNDVITRIQSFVQDSREAGVDFSSTENQILTPMNKTWVGTNKLNLTIQSMFWDRNRPYIDLPRHKWINDGGTIRIQIGSKVVYTTNSYELLDGQYAFNGEVGTVVEIDPQYGNFDVDFGDRIVTIPSNLIIVRPNGSVLETDPRKNIDLAYALTTHKAQGSEYKNVLVVLNKSTLFAQSRRNLYTAVTRAQSKCTLIADMVSITKSTKWAG